MVISHCRCRPDLTSQPPSLIQSFIINRSTLYRNPDSTYLHLLLSSYPSSFQLPTSLILAHEHNILHRVIQAHPSVHPTRTKRPRQSNPPQSDKKKKRRHSCSRVMHVPIHMHLTTLIHPSICISTSCHEAFPPSCSFPYLTLFASCTHA